MKKYIGLKMIQAEPQLEQNVVAGTVNREGYKIVYPDGYESWSPKDVFEAAYREASGASYSIALEGLFRGQRWSREGWNGPNQWIAIQGFDKNSKMRRPYIYMSPVDGELVPWNCSQSDALEDDWIQVG